MRLQEIMLMRHVMATATKGDAESVCGAGYF